MSQISSSTSSTIRAGDRVHIRRQRWLVTRVAHDGRCAALTVSGAGSGNFGEARTFLTPFDDAEPIATDRRTRVVSRPRWRRDCRALIAASGGADMLRTAESARIDLLPHQLEPALAVVRGLASRVLVADDVGLGKTIQAALIVAELVARGAAARVLVLSPAGLRDQWAAELNGRFGLPAAILDLRVIRQDRARWPVGVSPWALHPTAVVSLDYAKRPEVLAAICDEPWDIVVVDEAHHATAGSDRWAAVHAVCARAPYVILLTATPHSGDAASFDALRQLGQRDDEMMVFRRTRADLGFTGTRRIHCVNIGLTTPEREMHARLAAFVRAIQRDHSTTDVAIACAVLRKRAYSSAVALESTVRRRLAMLEHDVDERQPRQMGLPLDDESGELDPEDDAPAWTLPPLHDRDRERRMLAAMAGAAARAAAADSKMAALRRLLRRLREPAIVFTEYRDTLTHVKHVVAPGAAIVHGGLSRRERLAALQSFERGHLLLTTDAAGEGLNLHQRCRVVVNLELPWNPMRLEQRIGRVDRIGQQRRVHVFHLIAAAAGERRVLRHLSARVAAAQDAVGAADPLGLADGRSPSAPPRIQGTRLATEADAEYARLARARALLHRGIATAAAPDLLVTRTRKWSTRRALAGRILVIYRADAVDVAGRVIASALVSRLLRVSDEHVASDSFDVFSLGLDTTELAAWMYDVRTVHQALWTARLRREVAIGTDRHIQPDARTQAGLFDRRALRAEERAAEHRAARADRQDRRVEIARRALAVSFPPLRPALILLP